MRINNVKIMMLFLMLEFGVMSSFFVSVGAAPVCSFTYSVKGCNIYVTPSLTDVEHYQWSIVPGDGTTIVGCTGWIPGSSVYTQMFSLDAAGEYIITLQAVNGSGSACSCSQLFYAGGSSLSVVNNGAVQSSPKNMSFMDKVVVWFDSFHPLVKMVFIIIIGFLGVISFDVVFHVSRSWKKKVVYKTKELKR